MLGVCGDAERAVCMILMERESGEENVALGSELYADMHAC